MHRSQGGSSDYRASRFVCGQANAHIGNNPQTRGYNTRDERVAKTVSRLARAAGGPAPLRESTRYLRERDNGRHLPNAALPTCKEDASTAACSPSAPWSVDVRGSRLLGTSIGLRTPGPLPIPKDRECGHCCAYREIPRVAVSPQNTNSMTQCGSVTFTNPDDYQAAIGIS